MEYREIGWHQRKSQEYSKAQEQFIIVGARGTPGDRTASRYWCNGEAVVEAAPATGKQALSAGATIGSVGHLTVWLIGLA